MNIFVVFWNGWLQGEHYNHLKKSGKKNAAASRPTICLSEAELNNDSLESRH
jgi:hypothetical protein